MADYSAYYSADDSDYGRDQRIAQATVPFSDALGTSLDDSWLHNPNQELGDMTSLALAQNPQWRGAADVAAHVADVIPGASTAFYGPISAAENSTPASPSADDFMDPHTLNQLYGQSLGLSFDQPQRRGAVDIMVNNAQQQRQRDYVLAHAPDGIGFKAASLGTSLAVSALDPLNVAAAFVPVVDETRAGLWAERAGSTLARIGQGAVEGGVGTAALQPVQALHADMFQEQYGPMDAFMNVAFGTVLGGGLHAGLGKVSDMLDTLNPQTREAALRGAVGQMAEGRPVDVEAPLKSDPAFASATDSTEPVQPQASAPAPDVVPDATAPEAPADDSSAAVSTSSDDPRAIAQDEFGKIAADEAELSPQAQEALHSDDDWIGSDEWLAREDADLAAESGTDATGGLSEADAGPGLEPAGLGGGEAAPSPAGGAGEISPDFEDALSRARDASNRFTSNDEPSTIAPPDAGEIAAEYVRSGAGDDIDAELSHAEQTVADYERQGIITAEEAGALRDASKADTDAAEAQAEGARAAARCLLLHP